MELNNEIRAKAKAAKTPEELIEIASENDVEMTEEGAKAYFDLLHPKTGEISDDELDEVSGGACYRGDGRMVTTVANLCREWRCKKDGNRMESDHRPICCKCGKTAFCSNFKFCTYEKGLWLCNHESNRKR